MDASLFSWWGLFVSAAVVVAILVSAYFLVRGVARFVQRRTDGRMQQRPRRDR